MKIRNKEIQPTKEDPFKECKLGREPYANVLTDIVSNYADGFVLAINNEWGAGKTTFVKMWQKQLESEEFNTVYFNAWENDFDNEPMVALMAELKGLIGDGNSAKYSSLLAKSAVIGKRVLPSVAKAIASKYIDTEVLIETIQGLAESSTEILEEKIDEFSRKKSSMVAFREKLTEFAAELDHDKPLVFIIDELDRCRPDYAVEVLEQVKHLFAVEGIVFVLSIDKHHLGSSIKGYYGSECINSDEYLRRFIDLEYSIPKPSTEQYVNYLYEYYEFDEFFTGRKRDYESDGRDLVKMATHLFTKENAPLRQQEKVFSYARIVIQSFKKHNNVIPNVLFFLVFTKILKNEFFLKLERKQFSLQELSDEFYEIVWNNNTSHSLNLTYISAQLIWFYNYSLPQNNQTHLGQDIEKAEIPYFPTSKLEEKEGRATINSCFEHIGKRSIYLHEFDFNSMMQKINLTHALSFPEKDKEQ